MKEKWLLLTYIIDVVFFSRFWSVEPPLKHLDEVFSPHVIGHYFKGDGRYHNLRLASSHDTVLRVTNSPILPMTWHNIKIS